MKLTNFLILLIFIVSSVQTQAQTISAELDYVETYVTSYENGDVIHNAFLDFNIDFGNVDLADIESFNFDVTFSHNSSNIIDFYIDSSEAVDLFQTCLGASVADIVLISNSGNSRTYRFTASYADANIPTINSQLCPILATVIKNVIITPFGTDDTIFDCDEYDVELTDISIDIFNTGISLYSGLQGAMNGSYYSESLELPTCGHPALEFKEYSLHAERYMNQNGELILDLFLRFNDYPISGNFNFFYGNIRMDFNQATFSNPYIVLGGLASANLNGSAESLLSYNFEVLLENKPNESYHLGTVAIGNIDFNSECLRIDFNKISDFPPTIILDPFGNQLTGVDYRPVLKCGGSPIESYDEGYLGPPIFSDGKLALQNLQVSQYAGLSTIQVESNLQAFNKNEAIDLIVNDMHGKTIYHKHLGQVGQNKLSKNIALQNIETGIYIVQIISPSNLLQTKVLLQAN